MADNSTNPGDALYGKTTELAIGNFPISDETVPLPVIHALARMKAAAAAVNAEPTSDTGIDPQMAAAIIESAGEVARGSHDEQFPLDVFQTGSGTSTNMNVNEVIAALATRRLGRPVHPNDHVNASQSTNDTFPSALRVAALLELRDSLLPALELLERELGLKARQFADVPKAGRTHLMDATPVLLGDEFGGYRAQIREASRRLHQTMSTVGELPIGGTATGNGINAPVGFGAAVASRLADETGLDLVEAPDHFSVQGSQDALVELSGQLRALAVSMFKISTDIVLMASGPRTGLGEIVLRSLQPGSSIMPGKTNPVICEVVQQVCAEIVGNDATVAFAGSQGRLELNTFLPVMARNVMASIALLASAAEAFASKCIVTIDADIDRCRAHAEATPASATSLNGLFGYEMVAEIVGAALASGRSIGEELERRGLADDRTAARLNLGVLARGSIDRGAVELPGEDPIIPPELIAPDEQGNIHPRPTDT